ncbi:MAG: Bax inhibitor-1/YccA family protein [Bacteroidota bacterium]
MNYYDNDDNNNNNYGSQVAQPVNTGDITLAKTFMSGVFTWMFVALGITGFMAYVLSTNVQFLQMMFNGNGLSPIGWVIMFAPLGLALLMSFGFAKLSPMAMTIIFVIYAGLMGMSLSFIFLVYTANSIFLTFAVTAGTFGVMAIAGWVTKMDLTKFGSILMMALVGVIIAMVVNYFAKSEQLSYIISIAGVLIFTGLTAYDVQKLKRIGSGQAPGADDTRKLTIMGALTLYLDFINLFLFLLRILGSRR